MRRRLLVPVVAVVVLVLVAVGATIGVRWWRDRHRTDLERAVAMAPDDAVRFSWTDWAAVRDHVGSTVDDASTGGQVAAFLSKAYDADLSSTSAMVDSAPILQTGFGFSPADADWELLSQGTVGSVDTVALAGSVDMGDLAAAFASLGFVRPSEPTGVWDGGEVLLARIGRGHTISPQFEYLAIDAGRHLLWAGDNAAYLRTAVAAAEGHGPTVGGLSGVVGALGEPLAAAVYAGDYTCRALAMSQADADDQETARQLVAQAGGVDPVTGFAMGYLPGSGGRLEARVALSFQSSDQARRNADSRARLAAGPAVGQGGDFADRFRLGTVAASGDVVTMELHPVEGSAVLSDLSTGPVLFATC